MPISRNAVIILAALGLMPACGGDDQTPAASIAIVSGDLHGEELLLLKDAGALVSLDARDADGNSLEVSGSVTWASNDPEVVSVRSLGASTIATGLVDWFDVPSGTLAEDEDPSATVTAEYGGLSVAVDARVILDAQDSWTVTVGQDAPLLVPFLQDGREISQPLAGMKGELRGVTLGMTTPDLTLEGTFSSRDKVEGTGTDADGNVNTWSAER